MKLLNPGYESLSVGGSLYWNSKTGTCYIGSNNKTTTCDFTTKGIKNTLVTDSIIENVVWNTAGSPKETETNTKEFYDYERGNIVYQGRPTTWTGKIGLLYPSDYGYATSGSSNISRNNCLTSKLYNWNTECATNNYLKRAWTITQNTPHDIGVYIVDGKSGVGGGASCDSAPIYPTLFLKSNIKLSGGNGTKESPYVIEI